MKALVFCALIPFIGAAQTAERVQARIGEEMISLIDLKNFKKQMRQGLVPSSLLLKFAFKKRRLLKSQKELLNFMAVRNMLAQTAQRENIPQASNEEAEKEMRRMKGSLSHKAFADKLKKAGLSRQALRERIQSDLRIDSLLRRFVSGKILISEQEIESRHLSKHKSPLFKSFEYEFVSVRLTKDKKSAVLKKLKEGFSGDLQKMAQALGLEPKSQKLKARDIQPELKRELDRLSVSQISPLLFLGGSYYILQLKWKRARIRPEEQKKKERLEKALYREKMAKEIKAWIEEQKSGISLIIHPL